MLKNVVETEGPQMTSQYGAYALRAGLARLYARMRMRKHAHADQYVILTAFAQQQWFRERYTYISCLGFALFVTSNVTEDREWNPCILC